jgi:hypothetical protein
MDPLTSSAFALVALASALITLALLIALASLPSLCWYLCPHSAGVAALVVLALLLGGLHKKCHFFKLPPDQFLVA